LGKPTHIENSGTVIAIGGGVGIAPLYPIAKAMKEAGADVKVILGARNKNLLILENEMRAVTSNVTILTDDGSYGEKGLVTHALLKLLNSGVHPKLVIAIGPVMMMKTVCDLTREKGLPTIVSLNPIMVDGTGMCGGCRVNVGNEVKFACVDGPEFDGLQVDFITLSNRLKTYKKYEGSCQLTASLDPSASAAP
jgi:ferredoxin--NADP+ reductase